MTRVISIANQKGGVGKTTTTINLSASIAALGKRVLIIDIDAQGNATTGLGVMKDNIRNDSYDVLVNGLPLNEAILVTNQENLDIVPATVQLAGAETEIASSENRERRLKIGIDSVRMYYDYILIDCPPSLGWLTINAFTASDSVLIPVQCEFYALEGVSQLFRTIQLVQQHYNRQLIIEGFLLTMYSANTTLSSDVEQDIRNRFGNKVYETIIPRNIKLAEAPSHGVPINTYDAKSKGGQAYAQLAKEVIGHGS